MEHNQLHSSAAATRRQRQIEDCLYENLQHTSYQSLSVADICRQVGISRKAFYNYYHDKDACFCSLLDRMLHESMLYASTQIPDSATPVEAVTMLLDYWKERRQLFDIIIRNGLMHFLLMRNMEYVLREDRSVLELLNTPEVHSDADILACYMMVQLTLVMQWYLRGFDTPTEEMARKFLRVLQLPMLSQPGEGK